MKSLLKYVYLYKYIYYILYKYVYLYYVIPLLSLDKGSHELEETSFPLTS